MFRHAIPIAVAIAILALAGCGGTTAQQPMNGADVTRAEEISMMTARAKTWPTKWCTSLHVGMTRDEASEAMGAATSFEADYDIWGAFGYYFTASYDENGTITRLDYDTDGLTLGQRAKLTCAESRGGVSE